MMRFLRNLFGPKTVTVKGMEHAHKWETVHTADSAYDVMVLQRCSCGKERALELHLYGDHLEVDLDYYRARWLPKPKAEAKP